MPAQKRDLKRNYIGLISDEREEKRTDAAASKTPDEGLPSWPAERDAAAAQRTALECDDLSPRVPPPPAAEICKSPQVWSTRILPTAM